MSKKLIDMRLHRLGEVQLHEQIIELTLDFEGDRHHSMQIETGDTREMIVAKFMSMIHRVKSDEILD